MSRMHSPPHPGRLLKKVILPELQLTVEQAAQQLGVSRVQFSRVINGRAAITPNLARRLQQWIPGPTAETWLRMQLAYDLWEVEHSTPIPRIVPAVGAAAA